MKKENETENEKQWQIKRQDNIHLKKLNFVLKCLPYFLINYTAKHYSQNWVNKSASGTELECKY